MSELAAVELAVISRIDLEKLIANVGATWLTIEAAAARSSLSKGSIKRLFSAGKLTAHRPVRGRVLIAHNELDSVIRAATSTPRVGRGLNNRARVAR